MALHGFTAHWTERMAKSAMPRLLLSASGFLLSLDGALAAGAMCNQHLQQAIRDQTALPPTEMTGRVVAIGDPREWLELTDECGSLRVNLMIATVPQGCRVGSHASLVAFTDAGDLQDSISVGGKPSVEAQNDRISCR